MAAIDDLKTAYETEIAKISNVLQKAKATYELDNYIAAATAVASMQSNNIVSYTIANRTFTRNNIKDFQNEVNWIQTKLERLIYGTTSLVDQNEGVATA